MPVWPGLRSVTWNMAWPLSSSVRFTVPAAHELPSLLVLELKAAYDA